MKGWKSGVPKCSVFAGLVNKYNYAYNVSPTYTCKYPSTIMIENSDKLLILQ